MIPRSDWYSEPDAIVRRLHRAGWSIGDVVVRDAEGRTGWLVSGHNGENAIRAEGPTQAEAWRDALDQARTLGMLGGPRPGGPEDL